MSDPTRAVWFVLVCRICTPELPMPFPSAEARGKWAAAHTRGTGHDSWIVIDQPALEVTR
jgi:hypothetical protein